MNLADRITRARLDVPEVHRLIGALDRMLDDWAETTEGSPERRDLWRRVHRAAEQLAERTYGGPEPLLVRLSYWLRPYDDLRDARVWRWRRVRCLVLDAPQASA